jgi:hypothetical protein
MSDAVSFLLPVRDGARHLAAVLAGIDRQRDGRPVEVIAVDDSSGDGSRAILAAAATRGELRLLDGGGRGAAAAINLAAGAASHPWLAQIDQDVILEPGWLAAMDRCLGQAGVAAVQGYYLAPREASRWARLAGADLEDRYARLPERLEQVASGNTLYRAAAFRAVGGFDETLGYGYDNDLAYRLRAAGWELRLCREARSVHRWRETLPGYLRQQYGVGYGRLDLIAKHPGRMAGDTTSGRGMVLHAGGALAFLALAGLAAGLAVYHGPWRVPAILALAIGAALTLERAWAAVRASRRFEEPAALLFPIAHFLRDGVWALAIVIWTARKLTRRAARPGDSMGGRLYSSHPPEDR